MSRAVMNIPSALIRLDYNPAKDVLSVEWPDIQSNSLDQVNATLKEVIDTVRYYDVKRLLIDSSNTLIEIDQESYTLLANGFVQQLKTTRLEKVARIATESSEREKQAKEISEHLPLHTTIAFNNFTDRADAIAWLETGY